MLLNIFDPQLMAIIDPEHREEEQAAVDDDEDTGAQVASIVRLKAVEVTLTPLHRFQYKPFPRLRFSPYTLSGLSIFDPQL